MPSVTGILSSHSAPNSKWDEINWDFEHRDNLVNKFCHCIVEIQAVTCQKLCIRWAKVKWWVKSETAETKKKNNNKNADISQTPSIAVWFRPTFADRSISIKQKHSQNIAEQFIFFLSSFFGPIPIRQSSAKSNRNKEIPFVSV